METLKKQLHTDDNCEWCMWVSTRNSCICLHILTLQSPSSAAVNWLNQEKSLREQGVDETQVLVLR